MAKIVKVVISEDNRFVYGETYEDEVFTTPWMKYKHDLWFLTSIKEILNKSGIMLADKRYEELTNLVDGDINNLYYLASLKNDETLKWVLGNIAVLMKENNNTKMSKIISSFKLNIFSKYLSENKFDKSFSKDIFEEILRNSKLPTLESLTIEDYEKYEYDHNWYGGVMKFDHWFDQLISQDKYKLQGDDTEITEIISKIVSTNQETVDKIKGGNPKLINWLVGQCMKELKGKSSPNKVKDTIDNLIK